jgi:energy-coupling factor transporter ATP-binding protein EcfA2
MRIEWIEVENFKGFDKRRFEFDEHFTLIVGENGSGKTSLVQALHLVLQAWTDSAQGKNSGLAKDLVRFTEKPAGDGTVIAPVWPLRLQCSLDRIHEKIPLFFQCRSEDPTSLAAASIYPFQVLSQKVRPEMEAEIPSALPVCICFNADRRMESPDKPDLNKSLGTLPRRFDGYVDWDKNSANAQRFAEWMLRWQAISEEEGHESAVLGCVRDAILHAVPGISGIRYSARRAQLVVEWEGKGSIDFSKLSDGQKAIIIVIGDTARRAALLNPHLDDPVAETPGIVLIDEIDLHLHPRWQRSIMADLRRVFPKIQFIATTHSPIIISAAKDAKIIQLDADGSHEISQAYGMDVNWVVDVVQGAESQAPEVVTLVRQADDLIEEGKLDEARGIARKLEEVQKGPSPDSVGIVARIENLITLANAED